MSKKPSRLTGPAACIAYYGRNLEPSLPLEVREKALRELARALTKIDDRDIATTYDELKRQGITWKLVALVSEVQVAVDHAPPALDACPSPPNTSGTLLRWCLSCMANLTYFGGADLLKDVSGVLNILLVALNSTDPTIQSYAVVGLSNVRRAAGARGKGGSASASTRRSQLSRLSPAVHPSAPSPSPHQTFAERRSRAMRSARKSSESAMRPSGCSRLRRTSASQTSPAAPGACYTT